MVAGIIKQSRAILNAPIQTKGETKVVVVPKFILCTLDLYGTILLLRPDSHIVYLERVNMHLYRYNVYTSYMPNVQFDYITITA